MAFMGIAMTFVGFLIAMSGLGVTDSCIGRMTLALLGLAISLTGIIGVINRAYLKNAIWKR